MFCLFFTKKKEFKDVYYEWVTSSAKDVGCPGMWIPVTLKDFRLLKLGIGLSSLLIDTLNGHLSFDVMFVVPHCFNRNIIICIIKSWAHSQLEKSHGLYFFPSNAICTGASLSMFVVKFPKVLRASIVEHYKTIVPSFYHPSFITLSSYFLSTIKKVYYQKWLHIVFCYRWRKYVSGYWEMNNIIQVLLLLLHSLLLLLLQPPWLPWWQW